MPGLLVAAAGDMHHPLYTEFLESSLTSLEAAPDIFLVAGDVLKPGPISDYSDVISIIRRRVGCPIIAAFGNTEFHEDRPAIRSQNPSVTFLDDEAVKLDIRGTSTLVVGSTGSLERPTSWQKRNIPHITDIYRARVLTVGKLLDQPADIKILLTHYAPTYATLEGEAKSSFPWLGTRRFESVILERRPALVVHAHAHGGTREGRLGTTPIHNVSLPLNRGVVLLKLHHV